MFYEIYNLFNQLKPLELVQTQRKQGNNIIYRNETKERYSAARQTVQRLFAVRCAN